MSEGLSVYQYSVNNAGIQQQVGSAAKAQRFKNHQYHSVHAQLTAFVFCMALIAAVIAVVFTAMSAISGNPLFLIGAGAFGVAFLTVTILEIALVAPVILQQVRLATGTKLQQVRKS